MLRHHPALAQRNGSARPGHARAEHRSGRADLERERARALAFGILDQKDSARVVAHREIARFELVERKRARREHGVEHLALPGRHQEARVAAIAHDDLAGTQPARALRVGAVAAEALLAESVRQSARRDLGAARLCACARRRVDAAHADREAIAAQVSGAELVGMAHRLEHARARQLERECGGRVELGHREPLRSDRHAVLASRITHVLRPRTNRAREIARNRLGRAQALLDAHERVAARPGGRVERLLVDAEVLGRGADRDHANSGSCETGVKLLRCSGHGPSRASAAK